jgi:hypothetical protein
MDIDFSSKDVEEKGNDEIVVLDDDPQPKSEEFIVDVEISSESKINIVKIKAGNGQQKMKWLASILSSRIKEKNLLRQNHEEDNFIISGEPQIGFDNYGSFYCLYIRKA